MRVGVGGLAENKANSALLVLELGLSLAKRPFHDQTLFLKIVYKYHINPSLIELFIYLIREDGLVITQNATKIMIIVLTNMKRGKLSMKTFSYGDKNLDVQFCHCR